MEETVQQTQAVRGAKEHGHLLAQLFLGLLCYVLFVLPFARRIRGLGRIGRERRLFICNHVSLFDTILLGGVFWSRRRLPILVLGDASVWHENGARSAISAKVGYLIERGRSDRELLRQLKQFGCSREDFNLIVFPEGTRGDGLHVAECQPGLYTIARAAQVPIVPVFISHMQEVSSKTTRFRPLAGLRSIEVEFGDELLPSEYLRLDRAEFSRRMRAALQALSPAGGEIVT